MFYSGNKQFSSQSQSAGVGHLQRPGVGGLDEEGLEPLVRDEGEAVHREDVRVAAPDPRHRLVAQLPHLRSVGSVVVAAVGGDIQILLYTQHPRALSGSCHF